MVARLERRVSMLAPQINRQSDQQRKPWSKTHLSPKRVTGRALQARNERIKRRDNWTCKSCGTMATSPSELHVDHIIPISRGGSDDDSNLQSLCSGKGLCHDIKSLADRAI